MPKVNNVYCTLCVMIYFHLLGYSYGEVLRNDIKEFDQMLNQMFDQLEEKYNQMLVKVDKLEEKLKTLTENPNEGMSK